MTKTWSRCVAVGLGLLTFVGCDDRHDGPSYDCTDYLDFGAQCCYGAVNEGQCYDEFEAIAYNDPGICVSPDEWLCAES
jgi:hypothetical protein